MRKASLPVIYWTPRRDFVAWGDPATHFKPGRRYLGLAAGDASHVELTHDKTGARASFARSEVKPARKI